MSSSGTGGASDLLISLDRYGTPGSSRDNTAAIAQAFNIAGTAVDTNGPRQHDGTLGPASRAVYFPAGVWCTTQQVVIPRGVSVIFADGGVLRATATIPGALLTTTTDAWEGMSINGGSIDCNQNAQDGVFIRLGRYSKLRDVRVDDPQRHGVVLGDTTLTASCFEMKLYNVMSRRHTGLSVVAGSQGLSVTSKCSDSVFISCVNVGFESGIVNAGGDNRFDSCHTWGYAGAFPSYGIVDTSGAFSHYSKCVADSPTVAGFHFTVGYASMADCSTFLASTQTDNTVYGVYFDAGAGNFSGSNNRIQGASNSVRLAADYAGADTGWLASSTITGQMTYYSVNTLPAKNTIPPYSMNGQLVEKTFNVPGTVVAGALPVSIWWTVPVQLDSLIVRAYSGTGTQFQLWQGGTQLSNTFNLGDLVTPYNPYTSTTPVTLAANAGIYLQVVTAGTGSNFTIVFKARQNG